MGSEMCIRDRPEVHRPELRHSQRGGEPLRQRLLPSPRPERSARGDGRADGDGGGPVARPVRPYPDGACGQPSEPGRAERRSVALCAGGDRPAAHVRAVAYVSNLCRTAHSLVAQFPTCACQPHLTVSVLPTPRRRTLAAGSGPLLARCRLRSAILAALVGNAGSRGTGSPSLRLPRSTGFQPVPCCTAGCQPAATLLHVAHVHLTCPP